MNEAVCLALPDMRRISGRHLGECTMACHKRSHRAGSSCWARLCMAEESVFSRVYVRLNDRNVCVIYSRILCNPSESAWSNFVPSFSAVWRAPRHPTDGARARESEPALQHHDSVQWKCSLHCTGACTCVHVAVVTIACRRIAQGPRTSTSYVTLRLAACRSRKLV